MRRAFFRGIDLLPEKVLRWTADEALKLRRRCEERVRQIEARSGRRPLPPIASFSGEPLTRLVLERQEPWDALAPPPCTIPSMLTEAERRYYLWIGRFYAGAGAAVEIGTWLGSSTWHAVQGLRANPRFQGPLHAFDDFVWRSSNDRWLAGTGLTAPPLHASFEPLFREQTRDVAAHVVAERRRLSVYDGNESVPELSWSGGPIELLFVDCGRWLAVNEAWWKTLSPHFIPGRTLVVMQDWQNHKRVPELFWENTKIFTDSKGDALDLVHEVRGSAIATFLYR